MATGNQRVVRTQFGKRLVVTVGEPSWEVKETRGESYLLSALLCREMIRTGHWLIKGPPVSAVQVSMFSDSRT